MVVCGWESAKCDEWMTRRGGGSAEERGQRKGREVEQREEEKRERERGGSWHQSKRDLVRESRRNLVEGQDTHTTEQKQA